MKTEMLNKLGIFDMLNYMEVSVWMHAINVPEIL